MTGGTAVEQTKLLALKQRLLSLGYKATFGADTVELIEQLLRDLTHTTEAYDSVQLKDRRLTEDLSAAQAQLFPLRKENARLARENFQTRVELIAKAEAEGAVELQHRMAQSALEDRLADAAALGAAKDARVRELEGEAARLRRQIERTLLPDNNNNNSTRQQAARSIVISSPLLGSKPTPLTPSSSTPTATAGAVDTSLMSEGVPGSRVGSDAPVIAALRSQVEQLTAKLREAEASIGALSSAVRAREQELTRITSSAALGAGQPLLQLLSGEGGSGMSGEEGGGRRLAQLEQAHTQHRRLIAQLNDQLDFLNEQLAQREAQAAALLEAHAHMQARADSSGFREEQLAQARAECGRLASLVRAAEGRAAELQERLAGERAEHEAQLRAAVTAADLEMQRLRGVFERGVLQLKLEPVQATVIPSTKATEEAIMSSPAEEEAAQADPQPRTVAPEDTVSSGTAALLERQLQALVLGCGERDTAIARLSSELADSHAALSAAEGALADANRQAAALEMAVARGEDEAATLRTRHAVLADLLECVSRDELAALRLRAAHVADAAEEAAQADPQPRTVAPPAGSALLSASTTTAPSAAAAGEAFLRQQLTLLDGELRRLERGNEALLERLSSCEAEAESARVDAAADTLRLQEELAAAHSALGQLQRERAAGQSSAEELRSEVGRREQEVAVLRDRAAQLERLVGERDAQIQSFAALRVGFNSSQLELVEEAENLRQRLAAQAAEGTALEGRARGLEEELWACRAALTARTGEAAEVGLQQLAAQEVGDRERARRKEVEAELSLAVLRLGEARREAEAAVRAQRETEALLARAQERAQALEQQLRGHRDSAARGDQEGDRLETLLEDSRRRLEAALRECDELGEQRAALQSQFRGAEQRAEELRGLVGAMDADLRAANSRAQRLTAAVREGEEEAGRLRGELAAVREVLADRETQLAEAGETLLAEEHAQRQLVEEARALQADVAAAATVRAQLQSEVQALREAGVRGERGAALTGQELGSAQRALRDAEVREASLRQECGALRQSLAQRAQEVAGASQDLLLMTRENQALTSELAQQAQEREQLRARLKEQAEALAGHEQRRLALEAERGDLLQSYRGALQQARRLEADAQQQGVARQEGLLNVRRLEDEAAQLRGRLEGHRGTEQRWLADRAALSRQVDALNDAVVRLQRRLEAAEAEGRQAGEEGHGLRETNRLLSDRVALVMQRAAAAHDNAKMLAARLQLAESERDALRNVLARERQRAQDLEAVAMSARTQAALAYSRERAFPSLSAGGDGSGIGGQETRRESGIGEQEASLLEEGEESSQSRSEDSLPTTITASITDQHSQLGAGAKTTPSASAVSEEAIARALGTDFANEPDSLELLRGHRSGRSSIGVAYPDDKVYARRLQSQYRDLMTKSEPNSPLR